MVRINLISPRKLTDQHLIAEYNEILMLLGYVKKYHKLEPEKMPKNYTLGKGHILFFKDKREYLQKRHEQLKVEMKRRKFKSNKEINLNGFPKLLQKDWKPKERDFQIIRERLVYKINLKPNYYTYERKKQPTEILIKRINKK